MRKQRKVTHSCKQLIIFQEYVMIIFIVVVRTFDRTISRMGGLVCLSFCSIREGRVSMESCSVSDKGLCTENKSVHDRLEIDWTRVRNRYNLQRLAFSDLPRIVKLQVPKSLCVKTSSCHQQGNEHSEHELWEKGFSDSNRRW